MSQILKLAHENQQLKRQINQYQQVLGVSPYVDDSLFKGGYRVVKTIDDRNNIDCCHSKQGMIVCVIGEDLSFKEYRLISDCKNKQWEEIQTQVTENDVILTEDYSELSEDLITQKELNLILKQLILNLQTQINNIELIDEKVQITENTGFAQIGQNQKDFNKSVSDYKVSSDLKNQEQDGRLETIESENTAQNDLINGLQTVLDGKLDKGTYSGTAQDLKNSIDSKHKKLSSFDESILIETDGNVEGNVSLFTEYFNQQVCELNFTPIQIIGIYVNGIKQRPSLYTITLPKTISVANFTSGDYIEIQYTKLKN